MRLYVLFTRAPLLSWSSLLEYTSRRHFLSNKLPPPRAFDFSNRSSKGQATTTPTLVPSHSSSFGTFSRLFSKISIVGKISNFVLPTSLFAPRKAQCRPAQCFCSNKGSSNMEQRDLGACISNGGHCYDNNNAEFRPNKVLILTKLTRLEFERRTNPGLSEKELEQAVSFLLI